MGPKKRTASFAATGYKKAHCSTVTDEKMNMTKEHEGGMPLSGVAEEFSRPIPVSTISTILKHKECTRAVALRKMNLQMTIIMKKVEGSLIRDGEAADKMDEGPY